MDSSSNRPSGGNGTKRGLGLAVTTPPDVIQKAASVARDSGYHSFWLNNPPRTNALEILGVVARATPAIRLGVGVIPLSDIAATEIVREVKRNALPLERFDLGIGSGSGGVEKVAEGIRAIRAELSCRIIVAALGPRMCRLAGAEADGVLFNWISPPFAGRSLRWVREGAEQRGRPVPTTIVYVRVALGAEARERLRAEAARYEAIPQYRANFERMGIPAMETAVVGTTPQDIQSGLAVWDGVVDEVVVRAITAHDTVEEMLALIEAAKPGSTA